MDKSFPKSEHLCSKPLFSELMENGNGFTSFPLRFVWKELKLPTEGPYQIAFSVSKRRFKKAVDRNRMKRVLREAWRHQKSEVISEIDGVQYAFLIVYVSNELLDFHELLPAMEKAVAKWKSKK